MRTDQETNLALFIDFDNVALGARDAGESFDVNLLLQRLLEKGKIIVKRAYADWSHYKEYMARLHEAGIELIEIPMPKVSGKNSADIHLVVDAMDLCHGKAHLDTFVIVSGDSDFSPLVSKLRENNKSVIGVGVKNSTSRLLVASCDEFVFYDDLIQETSRPQSESLEDVPQDQRKLFDFLLTTAQGLFREGRELLYSSLIKDTMKRKRPDFNESKYGYSTFGDLLEDAKAHGLLEVSRDRTAGGTWVVMGMGPAAKRRRRRSSAKSPRPLASASAKSEPHLKVPGAEEKSAGLG
ncbi:MAG: NYN domain-containing protein, partial [Candidatus Eisenbacteria sp.]|nr:NYN domain-containing protein [Candidatus Eisenbacteria bacterium]